MQTYNFTIIASGLGVEDVDRLFEAGCDDATMAIQKGLVVLEFDREARTFTAALLSAIRDVRRSGAHIERVEPDHLVNASEIAARSGLGRAAVSLYAKGERSEGFPRPVARVTSESPLWDWVEVAEWMYRQHRVPRQVVVHAKVVRAANLALEHGHHPAAGYAERILESRVAEFEAA
ncbi:hypothetical protein [Alsobacter soli]|uniref:hypothetical protein n=1 Tax=Alsobacter soli TaxID=2109933 RepID=UPI0018AD520B|nr:hypothetical protein [Alsobacter soli]